MARYGSGSVPIATGWKCTNCRRTHRSSIPRSASGNTRARPALTTDTSRPPRNWSAPCPGSSERCNTILSQSDPICFLFADRYVPLILRGCILPKDILRLRHPVCMGEAAREQKQIPADTRGGSNSATQMPPRIPQRFRTSGRLFASWVRNDAWADRSCEVLLYRPILQ